MLAILKRELHSYFSTPAGYIFMGFFLLTAGIFFAMINLLQANPNYNAFLSTITFVFMLVVPVLTMRLLAEESRQKTDQLLLTAPLSVTQIVLGKYLAALTVFAVTLLVTCLYPIILSFFGFIAVPQIIGGYLGFFLLGACFTAIGLFISACTENQVIAAVVSFTVLLFSWLAEMIGPGLPNSTGSGLVFLGLAVLGIAFLLYQTTKNPYLPLLAVIAGAGVMALIYGLDKTWYDGIIIRVFDWFSLYKRYNNFSQGNLSVGLLVYYLSFAAAFVFLTIQKIEKRRWS